MQLKNNQAICAPASIAGTGAISLIRVSGEGVIAKVDNIFRAKKVSLSKTNSGRVRFGEIIGIDGQIIDDVLVSVFRAPHSYTGEDSVEISCHASSYIVSSILELLHGQGIRQADPGEFTMRAYLNGKMDLTQAEAVADLIASSSKAAHGLALKQMRGGFSYELKAMRSELLEIVSLMELELDFSEEEVEFADRERLRILVGETINHISRLISSFKDGNALKNGVQVAIAGSTNAGKSTLLNKLIGEERAIVSNVHGTTRDTIEECITIDGIVFRFIDTAGIRNTDETIEKIGIQRSLQKISQAMTVLLLLDVTCDYSELKSSIDEVLQRINYDEQEVIVLLNKSDAIEDSILNEKLNTVDTYIVDSSVENKKIPIISISAKMGVGIEKLKNLLSSSRKDLLLGNETVLVTNQRHVQALSESKLSLQRVLDGLNTTIPTDLISQDLREAISSLGTITGEINTDEVLGNIFKNFCIGK